MKKYQVWEYDDAEGVWELEEADTFEEAVKYRDEYLALAYGNPIVIITRLVLDSDEGETLGEHK